MGLHQRVVLAGPTTNDLRDMARAERKHQLAIALPRAAQDRQARIDAAYKAKAAVQERIALRQSVGFNAAALAEDNRLEGLRGGRVIEDAPRVTPGRRRRVSFDGLDFLLERFDGAGQEIGPAARRSLKRCWVAGMLYRAKFEREHGSGVGAVDLGGAGGGMMAAKLAREQALVAGADGDKLLREVARALGSGPRGRRELHVLQQVAGWAVPLRALTSGGRNVHLKKLALLRALEVVALVLRLP